MNEPNNEFRQKCSKAFAINGKLKQFTHRFAPKWFLKAISFKQNDPTVEKFFFDLVESTIKYREENNVIRKDFLQMLIELKNTGMKILFIYLTDNQFILQILKFIKNLIKYYSYIKDIVIIIK